MRYIPPYIARKGPDYDRLEGEEKAATFFESFNELRLRILCVLVLWQMGCQPKYLVSCCFDSIILTAKYPVTQFVPQLNQQNRGYRILLPINKTI